MADSAESIRHDDQQVEISVPQWKRELILRKRSHSKALGGPNSQICLSPPIHSGATSPGLSPASSGFNINIRDSMTNPERNNIKATSLTEPNVANNTTGISSFSNQQQQQHQQQSTTETQNDKPIQQRPRNEYNKLDSRQIEHQVNSQLKSTHRQQSSSGICSDHTKYLDHTSTEPIELPLDNNYNRKCNPLSSRSSNMVSEKNGVEQNEYLVDEQLSLKVLNRDCGVKQVHNNYKNKMVAASEIIQTNCELDECEELQYGPGIVSKLRCRYLSLALRQAANKQRPSIDSFRRATSLNNLVDDDDDYKRADTDGTKENHKPKDSNDKNSGDSGTHLYKKNDSKNVHNYMRNRQVLRGNESMKRARSVEALLRYDHNATKQENGKENEQNTSVYSDTVNHNICIEESTTEQYRSSLSSPNNYEDKILSARERGEARPKRLTSFMSETERPPQDLVKHTLRIFEANSNRRGGVRNNDNGDVANKVATYKAIMSQEKPPILYPKPPLSPKKLVPKPRTASPMKFSNAATKNNNVVVTTNTNGCNNKTNITTYNRDNNKRSEQKTNVSNLAVKYERNGIINNDLMPETTNTVVIGKLQKDNLAGKNRPSPPPIIPRSIEKTNATTRLNNVMDDCVTDTFPDSPITHLSKKIESLSIDSPISSHNPTPEPRHSKLQLTAESSDVESDETETDCVKRISTKALANIAKAGESTQFNFGNKTSNNVQNATHNNKSYLPKLVSDSDSNGTAKTNDKETNEVINVNDNTPIKVVEVKKIFTSPGQSVDMLQKQIPSNNVKATETVAIVNDIKYRTDKLIKNESSLHTPPKLSSTSSSNGSVGSDQQVLKNFINREKVDDINELVVTSTPKWNNQQSTPKKSWNQNAADQQTMVFNFSDRKIVPDYIENAGIFTIQRRELPKVGESGYVILDNASFETSTDPDDQWNMGPPSPCDVQFVNDNIIINGKSSLKKSFSRDNKQLSIKFDDPLTTTFEYPSETSLLNDSSDEMTNENLYNSGNNHMNNGQSLLNSVGLGSAPLGNYTPTKAAMDVSFELGITRQETIPIYNLDKSNGDGDINDPESLQYLKPATDEQNVTWSESTKASDLLF